MIKLYNKINCGLGPYAQIDGITDLAYATLV